MARVRADALRAGDSTKSGPMASRLEVSRSCMVQRTSTKGGVAMDSVKKPYKMRQLEATYGKPIETILQDAWDKTPSFGRVARTLNLTPQTSRRWIAMLGLEPHSVLRKARRRRQTKHTNRS